MPAASPVPALAFALWCVIVVAHFVTATAGVLVPATMVPMLPLFSAARLPDPGVALGGTARFVAALAVTLAAGLFVGGRVSGWTRLGRSAGRTAPVGLVLLGVAGLGLGLTGLWFPPLLLAPVLALGLAGLPRLGRAARATLPRSGPGWLAAPLAVAAWGIGLALLSPETFQDALRYHLFFPRRFLEEHRFVFHDHFFFWSYLGPVHMLYGAALAADGDRAAKAVNAAFAILNLAVVVRLARRLLPDAGTRWLAVALAFTAPGIPLVTASAFVEHPVSLFVLLALEEVLTRGTAGPAPWHRVAVWLGVAASVKYTAAFGAIGVAAAALTRFDRARWFAPRTLARALPWLAAGYAPWGLVRWCWTGDPVSPILHAPLRSLDDASAPALAHAYGFAEASWRMWRSDPFALAAFPAVFTGGHEGFWEHPGPALTCLAPLLLWPAARRLGAGRGLVWFTLGSLVAWMALFGGVSPHYVAGLFGGWTVAGIVMLARCPASVLRPVTGLLVLIVWVQAALSLAACSLRFAPRDVAFGGRTQDDHLSDRLVPRRVHLTARRELVQRAPGRGTVYVYGDDQSFQLAGRVHLDYEYGSNPLLWQLARASRDPAELAKRLRQRDWTHLLFTTFWPYLEGRAGRLRYLHDARTLDLMQDFWRRWTRYAVVTEGLDRGRLGPSTYVVAVLANPDPGALDLDATRRTPFLPGAEAITWDADLAAEQSDLFVARAGYLDALARFPQYGVLHDRLARLYLALGDRKAAARHHATAKSLGWSSRGLDALLTKSRP